MEHEHTGLMTEVELDALSELINMGVGRAAASLGEMVDEEVSLSVPSVAVITQEEAAETLSARENGRLIAVHQRFEGQLNGRAMLIFPETNSLELVKAVAGSDLSLQDIIDLEQEALSETGNIILNGCLGTISNLLQKSLRVSLPEIINGEGREVFNAAGASEASDVVLFLFVNFSVRRHTIRGYIAMLMDLPALTSLRAMVHDYIRRVAGDAEGAHVDL